MVETLARYKPVREEKLQRRDRIIEERIVCVATMMLLCCLMMVGTMLAITSQYLDMLVATMINASNIVTEESN